MCIGEGVVCGGLGKDVGRVEEPYTVCGGASSHQTGLPSALSCKALIAVAVLPNILPLTCPTSQRRGDATFHVRPPRQSSNSTTRTSMNYTFPSLNDAKPNLANSPHCRPRPTREKEQRNNWRNCSRRRMRNAKRRDVGKGQGRRELSSSRPRRSTPAGMQKVCVFTFIFRPASPPLAVRCKKNRGRKG